MRAARTRTILSLPLVLALSAACDGAVDDPPGDDSPPDPPEVRATWYQDVAPILAGHCTGCHTDGGIGPFTLEDYDTAKPLAGLLLAKVESGEMPPWSAVSEPDCTPRYEWQHDPRLPDAELATLRAWVEDGAAEGDPNDPAPLPEPPSQTLTGATHRLDPPSAYTTSGFQDELRCFVIELPITQVSWMTGLQFNPGNLEVDHHATLAAVPPAQADAVRARADENGTFECFGGVGIDGAYSLGVWVPGATPFETPAGTGIPLVPGTVLVMQLHYHPTGFEHAPDFTTLDMRLTTNRPERTFLFTAIGNAGQAPVLQPGPNDRGAVEFRIPANIDGHTEQMVFDIETQDDRRFPMTAIFPHMHYVGVDMKVDIERATPALDEPTNECLINVPRWDFDWQQTYYYDADIDALPTVGNGDRITITCEYNNTRSNPFVGRMLEEENLGDPVDVVLGEETTDEMCLIALGIILDN